MGVSPHLLCIQYTIFTGWCKFLSDFFVAAGGLALPAAFRGPNFYKKISRAMMHSQRPSTLTNPLLPQLQFNTKYVKLQVISYAFSIPYFLPNATAKPQNLPAAHPLIAAGLFCLTRFCCQQIHQQTQLLFYRQKKKHRFRVASCFRAKTSVYMGLFPSACSIHAFISAASVLKLFSRTTSTSFTSYRPSFR